MADIPRVYKLNKEKREAEENGKFCIIFTTAKN